jgi:hypothetical protein
MQVESSAAAVARRDHEPAARAKTDFIFIPPKRDVRNRYPVS